MEREKSRQTESLPRSERRRLAREFIQTIEGILRTWPEFKTAVVDSFFNPPVGAFFQRNGVGYMVYSSVDNNMLRNRSFMMERNLQIENVRHIELIHLAPEHTRFNLPSYDRITYIDSVYFPSNSGLPIKKIVLKNTQTTAERIRKFIEGLREA